MTTTNNKTESERPRLMKENDALHYMQMGRTAFRRWADSIGATRHIGGSVRYERSVIDKALDAAAAEQRA